MKLPSAEVNMKLKAAPKDKPMAAKVALEKLNDKGEDRRVVSPQNGPRLPEGGITKHLQGIAVHGSKVFLTTSASGGKIISATREAKSRVYIVKDKLVGFDQKVHPGGIQIIGHYLAIPVYNSNYSGVEIRDINDDLRLVKQFRTSRKPYCVGVTTTRDSAGEFYILAVVTENNGNRVEIYRTPSNLLLGDSNCFFELRWTYKAKLKRRKNPNKDWNSYPNNISLLSDTKGNVYFLGLYKRVGVGDNADLYHLDFGQPEDKMFQRLSRFHAKCHPAPAFRWGAGASVVRGNALEIYACEMNVKNKTTIRMDYFFSA